MALEAAAGGFLEKVLSPVRGFFAGFSASPPAACGGAACACSEAVAMGPSMLPSWEIRTGQSGQQVELNPGFRAVRVLCRQQQQQLP